MRPLSQDPTAGETARAMSTRPWAARPIHDPTDPRCEELADRGELAPRAYPVMDPTNPAYGKAAV